MCPYPYYTTVVFEITLLKENVRNLYQVGFFFSFVSAEAFGNYYSKTCEHQIWILLTVIRNFKIWNTLLLNLFYLLFEILVWWFFLTVVNCPVCHGGVCHNVKCINCKVNTEDCLMQGTCYIEVPFIHKIDLSIMNTNHSPLDIIHLKYCFKGSSVPRWKEWNMLQRPAMYRWEIIPRYRNPSWILGESHVRDWIFQPKDEAYQWWSFPYSTWITSWYYIFLSILDLFWDRIISFIIRAIKPDLFRRITYLYNSYDIKTSFLHQANRRPIFWCAYL